MQPTFTRRRILTLAAAGAAGASLFEAAAALAEDVPGPQREYGWFPMGIQSYSLRAFPVEKALDHVALLGLHHVELFSGHFAIDPAPANVAPMLMSLRRREIALSAHGVNRFTKDHEANRRIFEFANIAGIRNLAADPDPDAFDSLEKLVAEYGIRIAIHNHGPGHRYGSIAECKKALEGRHRWIGVCADLGHFIRAAEDPVKAIRELEGRLYGIHLKDFAERKGDAKGVVIGKGQLDVPEVFRALRAVRFPADGALSLEYEERPDDPIADLRACLATAAEGARRASEG
jgi:sugar phosphate isomerase/epimerase